MSEIITQFEAAFPQCDLTRTSDRYAAEATRFRFEGFKAGLIFALEDAAQFHEREALRSRRSWNGGKANLHTACAKAIRSLHETPA
jgi:hypothetical protein